MKLPASITSTYEYALSILMSRPNIRKRNLKPETYLSIDVADTMRRHTLQGRYRGVWCHCPNEGKRSALNGAILKAMGLIPGAPDFIFAWEGNNLFIELKVPGKKPNENQKFFAKWCLNSRVTYVVCHSVVEVEALLRSLGALT